MGEFDCIKKVRKDLPAEVIPELKYEERTGVNQVKDEGKDCYKQKQQHMQKPYGDKEPGIERGRLCPRGQDACVLTLILSLKGDMVIFPPFLTIFFGNKSTCTAHAYQDEELHFLHL